MRGLRYINVLATAVLLIACTTPATANNTVPAATIDPAGISNEQVNSWLQFYYRDPKPQSVVPMVQVISAKGFFYTDAINASLIGFLSGIFKRDPSKTVDVLDQLKPLPPADYQMLLLSAAL